MSESFTEFHRAVISSLNQDFTRTMKLDEGSPGKCMSVAYGKFYHFMGVGSSHSSLEKMNPEHVSFGDAFVLIQHLNGLDACIDLPIDYDQRLEAMRALNPQEFDSMTYSKLTRLARERGMNRIRFYMLFLFHRPHYESLQNALEGLHGGYRQRKLAELYESVPKMTSEERAINREIKALETRLIAVDTQLMKYGQEKTRLVDQLTQLNLKLEIESDKK